MKVCFAVPVRDKLKYLPRCLHYALGQDFSPLEVIFSDQGSKDGSWEFLKEQQSKYDGKHNFRVLQCPELTYVGMPALNEHLNWIHNQTDADIFISCAADDVSYTDRTKHVVEAYEKHNPDMVVNAMFFANADTSYNGETGWPVEDGFVKYEEVYTRFIGGSTIQSWTREFYEAIGGLQGVGSPDMVMPFLACLRKGCYYLNKRLHVYCMSADENNTGLEGVMRATQDPDELLKLEELCHFQVTAGIFTAATKLAEMDLGGPEPTNALVAQIVDRAASWQRVRQQMAMKRLQPRIFKA